MSLFEPRPVGPDTAARNYPELLRRYVLLLDLVRDLSSALHLSDLLERVALAATRLLECDGAALLLVEPLSGDLHVEATTHPGLAALGIREVPPDRSLAGMAIASGEPLVMGPEGISRAVENGPVPYELALLAPSLPSAFIGVPLEGKVQKIGVLEVFSRESHGFAPEDVAALQALAGQAAVAIESMRLFEQSDLITELVHEIRTPLGALETAAALLERPELKDTQRNSVLATLRQEIRRLAELTDEYLDLARLESGRNRYQPERFQLCPLLSECSEILTPLMHAQELRFVREFDAEPLELFADRARIKQVVLNLLSNAVKYNRPNGLVLLRARRVSSPSESDADQACIEVTDSGVGIGEDSLNQVFERFFRGKGGESRAPGTGLGLYIARHIVESHRGRIEVASKLGEGTTFTVRLPLAPLGGARPAGSPRSAAER
ncbi:MAG: GAF domain-containing sensor histidine kinase [Anaerolineales bacterium]